MLLGFANYYSARVAGRRFHNPEAVSRLRNEIGVCPHVHKVRIHGLKLTAIGSNGPGADVVELFVHIVLGLALRVLPALGLEDANGGALTLDGVILLIDSDLAAAGKDPVKATKMTRAAIAGRARRRWVISCLSRLELR
jgi:hypothetical protein